jgi:hypothetical protein
VSAQELSPSQMKRRLPDGMKGKVDAALDAWLGLAL